MTEKELQSQYTIRLALCFGNKEVLIAGLYRSISTYSQSPGAKEDKPTVKKRIADLTEIVQFAEKQPY